MLRTILVPLDGSERAEASLPFAAALARGAPAKVVLVRAVLTAGPTAPGALRFAPGSREEAHAYLAQVAEAWFGGGGEPLVIEDQPGPALVRAIDQQHADLVVMTTRGHGAIRRALWGSVTDYVLSHVSIPVLVTPKAVPADWPGGPARLVVALDGSRLAEQALGPAEDLARALDGHIVLVRAVGFTGDLNPRTMFADTRADAEHYLEEVAARLRDQGLRVETAVREAPAVHAIQEAAAWHRAHAIVMATHGRGAALRLILGSTAEAVMRSVGAPVVLVSAAGAQGRRAPLPSLVEGGQRVVLELSEAEWRVVRDAVRHFARGARGDAVGQAVGLAERLEALERERASRAQTVNPESAET